MNTIGRIPAACLVSILFFCVQAKGSEYFSDDWVLTQQSFQRGVSESRRSGSGRMEGWEVEWSNLRLKFGWRLGKDGFCAALSKDPRSISADVECVVELVSGSMIEIRAKHPYGLMQCSTVMWLRKIDPNNKVNLIGNSETTCDNGIGGIYSFTDLVAYMRGGSPGLVPFAVK